MEGETLQLMLYGDSIGHLLPGVKARGIKILKSVCPENQNYLFIDLQISSKAKHDTILIALMDFVGKRIKGV